MSQNVAARIIKLEMCQNAQNIPVTINQKSPPRAGTCSRKYLQDRTNHPLLSKATFEQFDKANLQGDFLLFPSKSVEDGKKSGAIHSNSKF